MPFPLMLPVYVHNEHSANSEKLGMESELEDGDIEDAYFMRIDLMVPYPTDSGNKITAISVGGETVMSPMRMDNIIKLIS